MASAALAVAKKSSATGNEKRRRGTRQNTCQHNTARCDWCVHVRWCCAVSNWRRYLLEGRCAKTKKNFCAQESKQKKKISTTQQIAAARSSAQQVMLGPEERHALLAVALESNADDLVLNFVEQDLLNSLFAGCCRRGAVMRDNVCQVHFLASCLLANASKSCD